MYMQRAPHPLTRYRSHDPSPFSVLQSTTTSETHSASAPHASGYVALAIVLAILLCSLIGFLTVRRLLPLSLKRRAKNKMSRGTSMNREQRSRVDMLPSLSDTSSAAPSSPSTEGPPTPSADYEQGCEHDGDLGVHNMATKFDACAPMPIPMYEHTHTQMHQPTLLSESDFPTSSAIRPHGLPLWPVPEESSNIPTFPSVYDDNELFFREPGA